MKYWQIWVNQDNDWFRESENLYTLDDLNTWIGEYWSEGVNYGYTEEEMRAGIKIKEFEVIETDREFNLIAPVPARVVFI